MKRGLISGSVPCGVAKLLYTKQRQLQRADAYLQQVQVGKRAPFTALAEPLPQCRHGAVAHPLVARREVLPEFDLVVAAAGVDGLGSAIIATFEEAKQKRGNGVGKKHLTENGVHACTDIVFNM